MLLRIVGVAGEGLLIREVVLGDYTEDEKGTYNGNRGGAKIGKNYQVTKERGEACLNSACLLGSVLLGHLRSVPGKVR